MPGVNFDLLLLGKLFAETPRCRNKACKESKEVSSPKIQALNCQLLRFWLTLFAWSGES